MSTNADAYNLATGNKWILSLPFNVIDPTITTQSLCFNLFNFTLPEQSLGITNFAINGHEIPHPTHVRAEDKTISFNYLLSSNWHQYQVLYKWFSKISNENGAAESNNLSDYIMDVTVTILSEYKNALFDIVYHGAWIQSMESIDFNYQEADDNIHTSFTIAYAYYTIENI